MSRQSQLQFSSRHLIRSLGDLPQPSRYWVAFSGGPDSQALLYAMAELGPELGAIGLGAVHINHGLARQADAWETHCRDVSASLGIRYRALKIEVPRGSGESLEAAAREARYRALAQIVEPSDMLLTAHTEDDQAETLLLQLLRGSGPDGLASMPRCTQFAAGWLGRPLLAVSREALHAYGRAAAAVPLVDPSNHDMRLTRNFIRHQVWPRLAERWPSAARTLSRASHHQAEAGQLMAELAELDLSRVGDSITGTLDRVALEELSPARRRNVLRAWIRERGLPTPSTTRLRQVERNVLGAGPGRNPVVSCGDATIRRYRDSLYTVAKLAAVDRAAVIHWDLEHPLRLVHGRLTSKRTRGRGISPSLSARLVTVRFRQGGERCQPVGRAHRQTLKHLFQEYRVPPWVRSRIPLIYIDNELAAVAGLWVCEPFSVTGHEVGRTIDWVDESENQLPH